MTDFFSTSTAGGAGDKYQVCTNLSFELNSKSIYVLKTWVSVETQKILGSYKILYFYIYKQLTTDKFGKLGYQWTHNLI